MALLLLVLIGLAVLVVEAVWLFRRTKTARQGFGLALLGVVAAGAGFLGGFLITVTEVDTNLFALPLAIVVGLLLYGGGVAVLVGIVKAGVVLVRTP